MPERRTIGLVAICWENAVLLDFRFCWHSIVSVYYRFIIIAYHLLWKSTGTIEIHFYMSWRGFCASSLYPNWHVIDQCLVLLADCRSHIIFSPTAFGSKLECKYTFNFRSILVSFQGNWRDRLTEFQSNIMNFSFRQIQIIRAISRWLFKLQMRIALLNCSQIIKSSSQRDNLLRNDTVHAV